MPCPNLRRLRALRLGPSSSAGEGCNGVMFASDIGLPRYGKQGLEEPPAPVERRLRDSCTIMGVAMPSSGDMWTGMFPSLPLKQLNGRPGKKPPAPSVKVRPGGFRTLVEILKGRKPRRTDDAETGPRSKPVPVPRGRG